MKIRKIFALSAILILSVIFTFRVAAQQQTQLASVACGDILDSEMVAGTPYQDTTLAVPAGTKIDLTITPLGTSFNPFIILIDSGGGEMLRLNANPAGVSEELISFQLASSNAIIRLFGAPPNYVDLIPNHPFSEIMQRINQDLGNNNTYFREAYFDGVGISFGAVTISVGCTLRDGTVINPGDSATGGSQPTQLPTNFVGFPGLAPVDFAQAVFIPFVAGAPNSGGIGAGFDAVFGFNLEAAAGDVLDLSVTRTQGNLNLGVAVLSPDNKIIFFGTLVTSESVTTKLTLPSAGQYIIGVFKLELLPPSTPENTAFQVLGTLNP